MTIPVLQGGSLASMLGGSLGGAFGAGAAAYGQHRLNKKAELEKQKQAQNLFQSLLGGSNTPQAIANAQESRMSTPQAQRSPEGNMFTPIGQRPQPIQSQEQAPQQKSGPSAHDKYLMQLAQAGATFPQLQQASKNFKAEEAALRANEIAEKRIASQEKIAENRMRVSEEKPARKMLIDDIRKVHKDAEIAKKLSIDYDSMIRLARSGNIRSGAARQILDKIGLGSFMQNPTSELAEKLIGDITNSAYLGMTEKGGVGADMYKQIAKTRPSLLQTPQGIEHTANVLKLGTQIEKQIDAEVRKIEKQYEGRQLPLNTLQLAKERAEPIIDKLGQKQLELVEKVANQKFDFFGNPVQSKNQETFEALPDAKKYKGARMVDDSGKMVESNGSEWVPVKKG